jgi:hypothetical protein
LRQLYSTPFRGFQRHSAIFFFHLKQPLTARVGTPYQTVRSYIHTWSQPGWLKAALDEPPKAVTLAFEAHCARLDIAPVLGVPHSEALKLALSSDGRSAFGTLLPRLAELAKHAMVLGDSEDRLGSDWQHVQGMWAAVDASGFAGEAELAALSALLGVGEATLSEEVAAAQALYAEGSTSAAWRVAETAIAHPVIRALWARTFEADKVSWEAFVGAASAGGLSILDLNALFPADCRIADRVAQLRAAMDVTNGVIRLAGSRRIAGELGPEVKV